MSRPFQFFAGAAVYQSGGEFIFLRVVEDFRRDFRPERFFVRLVEEARAPALFRLALHIRMTRAPISRQTEQSVLLPAPTSPVSPMIDMVSLPSLVAEIFNLRGNFAEEA